MRRIYGLLILIGLLHTGLSCKKSQSGKDQAEQTAEEQKAAQERNYKVDSSEIKKFFSWREKKEFGPGIERFYEGRAYSLAWSQDGKLSPLVPAFITRLEHVQDDGLKQEAFEADRLRGMYKEIDNTRVPEDKLKDFDLLLTSQFFTYAAQVGSGVTRENKRQMGWFVNESDVRFDSLLNVVLKSDPEKDPFAVLEPPHPEYKKLKALLHDYREYAKKGSWPKISGVEKLKLGDTSEKVVALRQLLSLTGDFITPASNFFNPKIFDQNLDLAVRAFQTRHGLDPDGVVAGKTLDALNTPIQYRIKQILVNMERWRLVPREFGDNYLFVNVPEFKLHVFENNKEVMNMRVVVGKEFHATPVFSDKLQYIVFSPYWNVPQSILVNEVLPALEKNPYYLDKNNMEVVKGYSEKTVLVNSWDVPWYNADDPGFTYRVRQRPGPDNPLGLVKFIFPNNHNVYLHDTPADHLFQKVNRAYSHGCIRIERPRDLAIYLLRNKAGWDEQAIDRAMHKGEEQYVNVKPMPVYILYFTAWVDDEGKMQVRDDLYGLDKTQAAEMSI